MILGISVGLPIGFQAIKKGDIGTRMMNPREWVGLGAMASVHFVVQVVSVFLSFGGEIQRLETSAAPGWTDRVIDFVAYTSTFPLVWVAFVVKLPELGRPLWELFVLNSLLWGWFGSKFVPHWMQRCFFPKGPAPPTLSPTPVHSGSHPQSPTTP